MMMYVPNVQVEVSIVALNFDIDMDVHMLITLLYRICTYMHMCIMYV